MSSLQFMHCIMIVKHTSVCIIIQCRKDGSTVNINSTVLKPTMDLGYVMLLIPCFVYC